ncbi:MAG: IPTL-CTERM sorting domain-containing protein [Casimicrobiaceae bacterium]
MKGTTGFLRTAARRCLAGALVVASALAVNAAHAAPFAYVPNAFSGNVSVIDIATDAVIATIPVGTTPRGAGFTPDGTRVYVTNQGADTVSAISTATNTVVATIPVPTQPIGAVVTPDGTRVYVGSGITVTVISTATNTVLATIPISSGSFIYGIAITPDGSRVYVADLFTNNIWVISTATNTVVATIALATTASTGIAVTPDGSRVYVANFNGNSVSVIDTATNTVTATVPLSAGAAPEGIAITPDGTRVYVANNGPNQVSIISTATNTVTGNVPVGLGPAGLAVTPDGARVYVANSVGNSVSVIATATNSVTATVPVGSFPVGIGLFITPGSGVVVATPTITTPSPLPGTTVGAGFSQTFSATGGTPPYTSWIVVTGAVPAGLTLNPSTGVLSGTPTASGLSTFTLQVTDSAAATASKSFSLNVSSVPGPAATNHSIPTLGEWALYSLMLLIAAFGARRLGRADRASTRRH